MELTNLNCVFGGTIAASIVVETDDGKDHWVAMFEEVVQQVMKGVQEGDDVAVKLVSATLLKYCISLNSSHP